MKRFFLLTSFVITTCLAFGQDELVNTYLFKSTMHGGTPMSGTSTTLAYTFVAQKEVIMSTILFEEEELLLKKGDTLTVYFISHQSYYNNGGLGTRDQEKEEVKPKKSFSCYFRSGSYHVSVNSEEEFKTARLYQYKKKKHTAKVKTKINDGQEHFAP